jgi:hypothetical protein
VTVTGTATFEIDLPPAPPAPPAGSSSPPVYEAKVLRVRSGDEHSEHELVKELTKLGLEGWYPSGNVGDLLILSRLKSAPAPPPSSSPVRGVLTINTGGSPMGLTVDTTPGQESVTYGFEDDKGNADGLPNGDGSGITVLFASSDPTLATVGDAVPGTDAEGNANFTAPITVVTTVPSETGVSFSGTAANVDGGALANNAGGAWIDPPASDLIPIAAGDPVEGVLSVAATA